MTRFQLPVIVIAALGMLALVALADSGPASGGATRWGDLDCSGSVSPVDSLKILRKDAGLSVSQAPGCLPPGAEITVGGTPRVWGDVDCANGINPVDALKILRFDAGLLSVSAIAGGATCPDIGSLFAIDTPTPTPSPTPSPTPVGSISELKVGSTTVMPGGFVKIFVTADTTNLGAYRIDVQYDSTLVTATACLSNFGVTCSIDVVAADTVRLIGTNTFGITGDDVILGTIDFVAGPIDGTAALTIDATTLVLADFTGSTVALPGTPTNGFIMIVSPTPNARH